MSNTTGEIQLMIQALADIRPDLDKLDGSEKADLVQQLEHLISLHMKMAETEGQIYLNQAQFFTKLEFMKYKYPDFDKYVKEKGKKEHDLDSKFKNILQKLEKLNAKEDDGDLYSQ